MFTHFGEVSNTSKRGLACGYPKSGIGGITLGVEKHEFLLPRVSKNIGVLALKGGGGP